MSIFVYSHTSSYLLPHHMLPYLSKFGVINNKPWLTNSCSLRCVGSTFWEIIKKQWKIYANFFNFHLQTTTSAITNAAMHGTSLTGPTKQRKASDRLSWHLTHQTNCTGQLHGCISKARLHEWSIYNTHSKLTMPYFQQVLFTTSSLCQCYSIWEFPGANTPSHISDNRILAWSTLNNNSCINSMLIRYTTYHLGF